MSEFQTRIIPNEFSHSNFSSFVRQLNKYDFHKQRFKDPQSKIWEFKHAEFRPENRDRPNLIKRKLPSGRNQAIMDSVEELQGAFAQLQARVEKLEDDNRGLFKIVESQRQMMNQLLMRPNAPQIGPQVQNSHQHLAPIPMQPVPSAGSSNMRMQHQSQPVIVVAMHDQEGRNIVAGILIEYGYFVKTTDNGAELVAMVRDSNVKLVVFDLVLASVDGLTAVSVIRQTNVNIPLILCINKDHQAQPSGSHELFYESRGVTKVLWRPFTKAQLDDVISTFM